MDTEIETKEAIVLYMCGFYVVRKGNYFEEEPIRRSEVEVRVGKLKNGKTAGKDEITGERIRRWR